MTPLSQPSRLARRNRRRWIAAIFLIAALGAAAAILASPALRQRAVSALAGATKTVHAENDHDHEGEAPGHDAHDEAKHAHESEADGHDEAEHEHEHEHEKGHADAHVTDHKHDEALAVKLSETAKANVGLQLAKLELTTFERTITVPAMVVERPGRSNIQIAAPLTGAVTRVYPIQGETVVGGQPLVDLRLTHEEVVEAQAEFLQTAENLDVVRREIERLEKVAADGVISGKTLLERKYEQQKLQAAQHSQRQRLLLHGLSSEQIDDILKTRRLLGSLTIVAPCQDETGDCASHPLQVEEIKIERGQHVKAGDPLCVLADYSELYIQGKAFEQDAPLLDRAIENNRPLTAAFDGDGRQRRTVGGLSLLYVAGKIEPESRAFLFYVRLPNQVVRTRRTDDGRQFSTWRFKPGQRAQLLVPVERWPNRIVLPVGAVVQDGAESYVFEQNGGHFDRRAVRVEYRDEYSVVVANDGVLTPGRMAIVAGAYQVYLAMKNKAGGAPDPHAGHNH